MAVSAELLLVSLMKHSPFVMHYHLAVSALTLYRNPPSRGSHDSQQHSTHVPRTCLGQMLPKYSKFEFQIPWTKNPILGHKFPQNVMYISFKSEWHHMQILCWLPYQNCRGALIFKIDALEVKLLSDLSGDILKSNCPWSAWHFYINCTRGGIMQSNLLEIQVIHGLGCDCLKLECSRYYWLLYYLLVLRDRVIH